MKFPLQMTTCNADLPSFYDSKDAKVYSTFEYIYEMNVYISDAYYILDIAWSSTDVPVLMRIALT